MRALSTPAAMDANREANADRDKLVSPLVHELRNSVAPIVNALHLLRRRFNADSQVPAELRVIERQISEIIETLDSIADAERLARGDTTPEHQRIELASVLRAAMNDKLQVIDGRGQHLHLRSPHGSIWIDGDPSRLTDAIARVLENAARNAGEGGDIWVDVAAQGEEVEIRVRNNGEEAVPDVRPEGDKGATSNDPPTERLTIGLAIARALIELHGGRITVGSRGNSDGAELLVRLPRAAQPLGSASIVNEATVRSEALARWPTANRRVLLVDDNEAVRTSFAAVLRDLGHDVRLAVDGIEALQVAEQWRPEFVVLDVHMPKINGYDVARTLRSRFPPSVMQLVMMSGTALDQATLVGARSAGFDHCIDKLSAVISLDQLLRGSSPERLAR